MQRTINGFRELLIGRHGQEQVRGLHADLELVEVVVLQDASMVESAFDHRLGTGLAVAFQQVPLQRSGIDADPHRTAVVARCGDHLAHPIRRADIAGIDPQAGRPRLGRFDAAFVVEVDVGHDRDRGGPHDRRQGGGRVLVRAGDPHDIGAGLFQGPHLGDGRRRIAGHRVGHRLDRDRRVPTDLYGTDADLAAFAPLNGPPGAIVLGVSHDGKIGL